MKAIKVVELGFAEVQEVAIPTTYPDYVLVKVEAVALNPADWKSLDSLIYQRFVSRTFVPSPP